jgi:hypothetical protein
MKEYDWAKRFAKGFFYGLSVYNSEQLIVIIKARSKNTLMLYLYFINNKWILYKWFIIVNKKAEIYSAYYLALLYSLITLSDSDRSDTILL